MHTLDGSGRNVLLPVQCMAAKHVQHILSVQYIHRKRVQHILSVQFIAENITNIYCPYNISVINMSNIYCPCNIPAISMSNIYIYNVRTRPICKTSRKLRVEQGNVYRLPLINTICTSFLDQSVSPDPWWWRAAPGAPSDAPLSALPPSSPPLRQHVSGA